MSRPNNTESRRRALFGIYYGVESMPEGAPQNLREWYYSQESSGRRRAPGGKANQYHTGMPTMQDAVAA